jgi:glutaryl-CoA dehydrogenase (non-decarboxylating)
LSLADLEPVRTAQWHGFQQVLAELGAADADAWDEAGRIPERVLTGFGARGLLGGLAATTAGGAGLDGLGLGLLAEAVGAASGSLASLLTVHSMVVHAVQRFGSASLKQTLLPRLARGEICGGFALSEPGAGTDIAAIETEATWTDGACRVSGAKTWISFGQDADVFLVFARSARGPIACVVEASAPGLTIEPVDGMLGFRAARLATLRFDACALAEDRIIGRPGFGLGMVALDALNIGRLCIAWASCGVQRACLAATIRHVTERRTSRGVLGDEPGIRSAICDMRLRLEAAQALALAATAAWTRRDEDAPQRVMAA